jgi:hypothetical protein
MSRVVFNVGGTRFETTVSTIRNRNGDLLNMLLDHREGEQEIFIDRDPSCFQKILNIYRGSGDTEVDEEELDYYGLIEKVIHQKTKREEIEEKLIALSNKRNKQLNKDYNDKLDKYAAILQLCLDNGKLEFVYADSGKEFSTIPCTLNGVVYTREYFSSLTHSEDLKQYARNLGYRINVSEQHGDKKTKYEYKPASNYNGSYTNRQKTVISIELLYLQ